MDFQKGCIVVILLLNFDVICSGFSLNNSNIYELYAPVSSGVKNPECVQQSELYFKGLMEQQIWALKMLDASGKVPTGILSGNMLDMGQFSQCYDLFENVNGTSISGKYCLAEILVNQPNSNFPTILEADNRFFTHNRTVASLKNLHFLLTWAICIPSSCSAQDLQSHLNIVFSTSEIDIKVKIKEISCQDKQNAPQLDKGAWIVLSVFGFIGLLILGQTTYECYLKYTGKSLRAQHPMLIAFSIMTNGKKLCRVDKNTEIVHCLNGIRFWSTVWIILGHKILFCLGNIAYYNPIAIKKWFEQWLNYIPVNGFLAVDNFFFMSGFLVMFLFLKAKGAGKPINFISMYLHRYLRLTPPLGFALLFTIYVAKYVGSGPFWPQTVENDRVNCERNWWVMLLYFQNYNLSNNMCLPHTWYLSADFQFYLLSPIFLIIAWKYPRITIGFHLVSILAALGVAFGVLYHYDLVTGFLQSFTSLRFSQLYYMPAHTRIGTYIAGLLSGFIIYQKQKFKVRLSRRTVGLCWLCSTMGFILVPLAQALLNQESYTHHRLFDSIFEPFYRILWCLCLFWVVFACHFGYGGFINSFLNLPIFQILARLSYSMYIVHFSILLYRYQGTVKSPRYFSNINLYWELIGDFVIVTIVAVIWTLSFEVPFANLEVILFHGRKNLSANKGKVDMSLENHSKL